MSVFLMPCKVLTLLPLVLCYYEVWSYKPVVIIHGILDTAASMDDLKLMIKQAHPETNVTVFSLYDEISSIDTPMWTQVNGFKEALEKVMAESKDGIHLIGYSQGGIMARAVIENSSNHNVVNFISLSSPQMGQFGVTSYLSKFLPKISREFLYSLLYTQVFQDSLSLANYWNDPLHAKEYLAGCNFLPFVNNNDKSKLADKELYKIQKQNFEKIKNLIVIGGPQDGVITPWQSALFGFYDVKLEVLPMKQQKAYLEDWFGLKTIDMRNAIHSYTFPNISHVHWHHSKVVFDKAIEPWLT
ncbi:lysosomal thioesterase PPT2-A-like [Xenia sp. Carnegie-2017]|uniref:lysosomal thioesterase PPT2-A-like n=1 Tax=Xenia sp. Carnegie-2017 TaxID=2897299 RepID=UPI001F0468EA|nr:lysosomal thioesterase PPT2-A-like [Xenia sp. Carnegie-2017]